MHKSLSRTSHGLPYGSLITFILLNLKIPFYGEPNLPSSCINLTSIHLCQITWNSNNESWYWRGKCQTNLDNEDISSSPSPPLPPPPRSRSQRYIPTHSVGYSSSSSSLSCLKKIFRRLKKTDKKIDAKFGEMKDQLDRVERKQQKTLIFAISAILIRIPILRLPQ